MRRFTAADLPNQRANSRIGQPALTRSLQVGSGSMPMTTNLPNEHAARWRAGRGERRCSGSRLVKTRYERAGGNDDFIAGPSATGTGHWHTAIEAAAQGNRLSCASHNDTVRVPVHVTPSFVLLATSP